MKKATACVFTILLLVLWSPLAALAEAEHPLEPLDLSSPRATLKSFLTTGDALLHHIRDEYWGTPSSVAEDRLHDYNTALQRMFDMREIPPAARYDLGRDVTVYLYEVLSRIELPPEADIPDAAFFAAAEDARKKAGDAEAGDGKKAGDKSVSWTIPHTEITLVRVMDGPQVGQFLFSSSTVLRAKEFYKKVRTLPYRRDVPIKNYAKKRSNLNRMFAPRNLERFPEWLKRSVHQQAVWKWMALAMLIAMAIVVIVVIHRLARRRLSDQKATVHMRRLATPLTLLLISLVLDLANSQLTLTGWVSGGITWGAVAIRFYALVWFAWTGLMAVAEKIIASPKIPDQSLNAHLLRLIARTFSIAIAVAIILYVSNRLGAPLYGLIAGLGVGGIALALAAQPTIENFIGSLNLFADQPVRVGDFCRYGEDPTLDWQRTGHIASIGIRSTRIRGIDHSVTTIPNAEFSKMHIVNYTVRRRMLLLTILGLRYETTDDQLRFVLATMRDMLLAHPRVLDEEPRVRFAGFGNYSLNVEIRVDIDTSDFDEFREIREDIYLRVMKIVKDAGTAFAFPSRTVYHTSDGGLDAERRQEAEANVQAWCSAQELPFPRFSAEHRKKMRNTLDYPPEGSLVHQRKAND